jgi:superfamily I DNA/RNA helicase
VTISFRIADTFLGSLAQLSGAEQRAVKTTAFDLQLDPTAPGLQFHRVERSRDPNFWSVRVNKDVRLIVHRTAASLLICFVGHHDDAYDWARRRRIEQHPVTGAAQLVELPERAEIAAPSPLALPLAAAKSLLFDSVSDDVLLGCGVPPEWLGEVRRADEDTLFDVATHLPAEAAEALLNIATAGVPAPPGPVQLRLPPGTAASMSMEAMRARPDLFASVAQSDIDADAFQHPDAQRRFRVLTNIEELERALDYPWERWAVFLHPAQRRLVERSYNGPARISGSAGTGKTIVALHRAVFLARRDPAARILLTTFSKPIANALKVRLRCLVENEAGIAERIAVNPVAGIGYELYASAFGQPNLAPPALIDTLLQQSAAAVDGRFPARFLAGEWRDVVDAWQLKRWEDYRDVARLGRKTRIGGKQREILWAIFEQVRARLAERRAVTWAELFGSVTDYFAAGDKPPFDFAVIDEAQDVGVSELRFLAAIGAGRTDGLFFAGDLGQRIFQQPFSWRSLGVDVRGRSNTLRINYRTSHQIRAQADRLLPASLADVDGNEENRRGTISVFNGPAPTIQILADDGEEAEAVGRWIADRVAEGVQPHEIGLFVRAPAQLRRARAAAKLAGVRAVELSEKVETTPGRVSLGTMHLAKGLEFRAVAVMACDDEVIPLQGRIETVADDADLEDVYNTERHLLYVACTRARDHLLVTGVKPGSEFLDDLAAPAGRLDGCC